MKDFDGINGGQPFGSLMQASNGMLYGLTRYGGVGGYGTIFSFNLSSSAYTKLVDFDRTKGTFPFGSLMQANDGKLYGMTHEGGNYYYGDGAGVIFSFDPSSSTYIKVKDFNYTDGTNTSGSLVQASNGKLYGMTNLGGSNGCGVVFALDPSTSIYTKLVDFNFTSVGYFGLGVYGSRLMQANDGKLYGITQSGGTNGGFSDCFIFS